MLRERDTQGRQYPSGSRHDEVLRFSSFSMPAGWPSIRNTPGHNDNFECWQFHISKPNQKHVPQRHHRCSEQHIRRSTHFPSRSPKDDPPAIQNPNLRIRTPTPRLSQRKLPRRPPNHRRPRHQHSRRSQPRHPTIPNPAPLRRLTRRRLFQFRIQTLHLPRRHRGRRHSRNLRLIRHHRDPGILPTRRRTLLLHRSQQRCHLHRSIHEFQQQPHRLVARKSAIFNPRPNLTVSRLVFQKRDKSAVVPRWFDLWESDHTV